MTPPFIASVRAVGERRRAALRVASVARYAWIVLVASAACMRTESLLDLRFTAGRFSGAIGWNPCTVVDSTALVPRTRCAEAPLPGDDRFRAFATATANRMASTRGDTRTQAFHAQAITDLQWHSRVPATVDRSVRILEELARRDPGSAIIWNDLAVGYLTQAEYEQKLLPLLRALNAVEHARRIDASTAVLFNRALILERLYLYDTAHQAWEDYLRAEHSEDWQSDAKRHFDRLARLMAAASPFGDAQALLALNEGTADANRLDAFARQNPQAGRELGLDLLGEWGRAISAGDTLRAERALGIVRRIAACIDALGGDRSLWLALRAIEANAGSASRTQVLGKAHARYAEGFRLYGRASYDDAAASLADAEAGMQRVGSSIARWAALFRATSEINLGAYAPAEKILRRIIATATPAEPSVHGKAIWMLGVIQVRLGAPELANQHYREALPLIERSVETENVGVLSYLLAEGLEVAGQTEAGRTYSLRGLHLLSRFRHSRFLGNHIGIVARYARGDGLSLAAIALMDEVLAITSRLDKPQVMAWAHGERARDFLAIGDLEGTRAALAEASPWVDRIGPGLGRDQIRAAIQIVYARYLQGSSPRAARELLANVIADYRASNNDLQLPQALHDAATAEMRIGDTVAARSALQEAIAIVEARRGAFASAESRTSYFETTEAVFDAMIAFELDEGHASEALSYLERARAAAWHHADTRSMGTSISLAPLGDRVPPNALMVVYAVLDDRLAMWRVSAGGIRYHQVPVRRDSLAALVNRLYRHSADASTTEYAATALFDLLVRPLDEDLSSYSRLIVVPDRELWRVPFAALRDQRHDEYVVERLAVSTLPSAAFLGAASRAQRSGSAGGLSVLAVGDPSFEMYASSGLTRLPGAAREARDVAAHYARTTVLLDTLARQGRVVAELPRHAVFHFAGHAVENAQQPELSHLVLAPDHASDDGALTATEIGRMRLSNLRMVILSACSTLDARATHVGPIAGLAYSFLRAGVPETISSLTDVDDESATSLLTTFHRNLVAGHPAAEALRLAQISELRAPTGSRKPTASWSTFIHTGL